MQAPNRATNVQETKMEEAKVEEVKKRGNSRSHQKSNNQSGRGQSGSGQSRKNSKFKLGGREVTLFFWRGREITKWINEERVTIDGGYPACGNTTTSNTATLTNTLFTTSPDFHHETRQRKTRSDLNHLRSRLRFLLYFSY